MKISEVIEITTLTKKAINYYEGEGLVKPAVNPENSYREYSQKDIDKLIQISVLRQFDVPVKDIKEIIDKPEKLREILEQHLSRMEEEVKRLEKSKNLLKSCINRLHSPQNQISEVTKELSLLNKSLEMDERIKEGFMKRQLQRIFPGKFGRMMMANYSAFFNEPIDTEEKEKAWIDLVKYMDDVESIEYPEEMSKMYEALPDEYIENIIKFREANVKKWISITPEEMMEEKRVVMEFYYNLNENKHRQEEWQKFFKMNRDLKERMNNAGYYSKFNENLKILSSDYRTYAKNTTDFYNSLDIKVNDEGNIIEEGHAEQ